MRILLICLDNLGDLVFTSSLVGPLTSKFPDAAWSILCKDYAADIARCFPVKADIEAADPWWDGSPGRGPGRIAPFLGVIRKLRKQKPDLTIVTSTNWRAAAVARAIGSRVRIGFDRKKSRLFLTEAMPCRDWKATPVTRQLAELLRPLGVEPSIDAPPCQLISPGDSLNQTLAPQRSYVVLHPFAGNLRRCWALSNWGELARKIRQTGRDVVWMGRDDEIGRIHEVNPDTKDDFFMQTITQGQLSGSLAVTSKADALIGHDSGPIHFAAALGVPVLGLYLPSEYPRTISKGLAAHAVIHRPTPGDLTLADVWDGFNAII